MKNQIFTLILIMSSVMFATDSDQNLQNLPKYTNQIIGINQIQGHKNYTLHLTFEKNNPIMVYAPESFQESQDKKMHHFILPNTNIACDYDCDFVQTNGENVELSLQGTMLLNVTGQDFILMTVSVE
jgi:hypothetical protein